VERARRVFSSSTVTKIPRSCDRVNRVLMFMGNFIERATVTKAGLDALIYFAKNGNFLRIVFVSIILPVCNMDIYCLV
jgi:hypothetical protein